MGNFYTNITLYGADRTQILANLKGKRAAVSPTVNEFTVVWDEESDAQDRKILENTTKRLTHDLKCPALAVLNHDDDVLIYMLFASGKKLDEYNSNPGFGTGEDLEPEGGNALLVARTFGVEDAAQLIKDILHGPGKRKFAFEQHEDLVKALGMPSFGVGMGYAYLAEGECPPELEEGAIVFCE